MQGAAEGRGVAGAKALGEQGADDAREYVARAGLGERGRAPSMTSAVPSGEAMKVTGPLRATTAP